MEKQWWLIAERKGSPPLSPPHIWNKAVGQWFKLQGMFSVITSFSPTSCGQLIIIVSWMLVVNKLSSCLFLPAVDDHIHHCYFFIVSAGWLNTACWRLSCLYLSAVTSSSGSLSRLKLMSACSHLVIVTSPNTVEPDHTVQFFVLSSHETKHLKCLSFTLNGQLKRISKVVRLMPQMGINVCTKILELVTILSVVVLTLQP